MRCRKCNSNNIEYTEDDTKVLDFDEKLWWMFWGIVAWNGLDGLKLLFESIFKIIICQNK